MPHEVLDQLVGERKHLHGVIRVIGQHRRQLKGLPFKLTVKGLPIRTHTPSHLFRKCSYMN